MKIAVPSTRGRLLALCALSAALHLLCLQLAARHLPAEPPPVPGALGPIALRLALNHAPAPARPDAGTAPAQSATDGARVDTPQRAASPSSSPTRLASARPSTARSAVKLATTRDPVPNPALSTAGAGTPAPAESLAAPAADLSPPAAAPAGVASAGDNESGTLRHYRVRLPEPTRLTYTLTRHDAAGRVQDVRQAYLDWRSDGEHYQLETDGVMGRLTSSGTSGDDGVLPQRFTERHGERERVTGFDHAAGRILFADGTSAPDVPGVQDTGSLPMQLAGIGLARPDQMRDEITLTVAQASGTEVVHFQVLGTERIQTGAGELAAIHLAQRVAAGHARLDVWLAPDQGWLPVQMRLTESDGSSAIQLLSRVAQAPPR